MSLELSPQVTPMQEGQESVVEKMETGKKVFEFLDRTKFLDIRKTNEQFEEWFQKLSYEDYTSYLTRLNGVLRDVPIKNRTVDGENVEISFGIMKNVLYLPPSAAHKDGLIRQSFDALKKISDNEDRALLAYYTLQAIHPYSDGNGRTGRLLHEIISDDGKNLTEENLSELLDHDKDGHAGTGKGRDVFAEKILDANSAYYYVNREIAKKVLGEDFMQVNGGIFVSGPIGVGIVSEVAKQNLCPEEIALVKKILGEGDVSNFPFRGIVLAKLIYERPHLEKYVYQAAFKLDERRGVVPDDCGKKSFAIDGEEIMPNLSEDDVRRLIEIHKEVKIKFVQSIIDIFTNPDKHKIKTKEGKDVTIKSVFRK